MNGCRLMQSASDLFLGWTVGPAGRQFYVRQLKDMKIKMLVEIFNRTTMMQYAELCGWTLARAHARCGEPAKSADTSARATNSTGPSRTFLSLTQIKANAITRSLRRR